MDNTVMSYLLALALLLMAYVYWKVLHFKGEWANKANRINICLIVVMSFLSVLAVITNNGQNFAFTVLQRILMIIDFVVIALTFYLDHINK